MAATEKTTAANGEMNGKWRKGEAVAGVPAAEELMLLLEQQDLMMESLVEEVSNCKKIIAELTMQIEDTTATKQTPNTSKTHMSEMRRDINEAMKTIDELRDQKKNLEAEIDRLKSESNSSAPFKVVDEMRTQMREAEFERDRMERELIAEKAERERLLSRVEELEKRTRSVESARREWEEENAAATREIRASADEYKFRAEEAEQQVQQLQQRSAASIEVLQQRAEHAENHARKCQDELVSLRKERAALVTRTDFLTRESNELRTKSLTLGVNGGNGNGTRPDDQTRRLLRDQADLIRTLKEECTIMAERLEEQAGRHKSSLRELRRTNKELEQRIEKLLKI